MSSTEEDLGAIKEELKWVTIKEKTGNRKSRSNVGILNVLVPAGCVMTVGVLGTGLYHMYMCNPKKQQLFMRYRILAQGVTLAMACVGMFHHKISGS